MRNFYGRLERDEEKREMAIADGLLRFQNYNVAKNLAEKTIRSYTDSIEIFRGFYDFSKPCDSIDESVIFDYLAWLRKTRRANDVSINTYLRPVRAMCYYFMEMGFMPRFKIKMGKAEKKIKATYTDEELARLLEKPNVKTASFADFRNWTIINYLLATGNREATVCGVKIGDVDFDGDTIHLTRTKNRREQVIPMSKTIRAVLKEYLKYRDGKPEDWLFCNVNGERLTEGALRTAVKKYNKRRGVMKTSIHLFRHTFAKKWILNGGDVFRLQKILGHSSMEIVREYVNMFSDDLKRDFDAFNPLEEFSGAAKERIQMRKRA